ncbi:MAG: hypothetical protein JNK65_06070 [Deltaproteobacteria bacterium]|nr:hypothetical protein [Deltaproteobacteria bacterium]
MRNFLKFLSLLIGCSILPACGAFKDAGIETDPLVEGESIIIKFDTPFDYTYYSKGKQEPITRHIADEEVFLLKNKNTDPNDAILAKIESLHFKIDEQNNITLLLGPNPAYPVPNELSQNNFSQLCGAAANYPACVNNIRNEVPFENLTHPEDGVLDALRVISFSAKPYVIVTQRKEALCINKKTGLEVVGAGKTPQLKCDTIPVFGQEDIKYTGKIIETSYPLDILKEMTKDGTHSMIVSGSGSGVRIVLKNTNYVANNPIEKPTQSIALQSVSVNFSKSNSNNSENSGKGSCSLSQSNNPQSISGLLLLSLLPSLLWVCFRRVVSSHPAKF